MKLRVKILELLLSISLSLKDILMKKINASCMLGIIKRNFKYMDNFTFTVLYESLVRTIYRICYQCLVSF